MPVKHFRNGLRGLPSRIRRYDAVQPLDGGDPAFRAAHRLALGLLVVFVLTAMALIAAGAIDNKPTTASTGLVAAHRAVAQNWIGWFSEGIWWRGQQTPTPLPFTIHGLFFTLAGYTVRGILVLHTITGAVAAWLLFRITARRYGPWAGLLATGICLATPLFLHVTIAGWTFVWATLFLLLAIDLADRAALRKRARWFLLAGLALGCAGMSRPENYAVAALFVLMVPFPIRYRAAFLLLAFAYPAAQFTVNNLLHGAEPGLRILDDPRSAMGYPALFQEWFGSVHRNILNRNFAWFFQWALIPAFLVFGLPRHRLLAGILAYFWVAFFAAYAMRRLSFNHEGYYYAHVVLSMPFLAAALAWLTAQLRMLARRAGAAPAAASATAVLLILGLIAADRAALRGAYADRFFYRAPEPVRELRDQLAARLEPGDALVLDYFADVSWMLAEIEGDEARNTYYYNTKVIGRPRPPLNAVRKDLKDSDVMRMNRWVYENYTLWREANQPRYRVMLSSDAWEREMARKRGVAHYRMFGLRAAMDVGQDSGARVASTTPPDEGIVFANSEFFLYDTELRDTAEPILHESFDRWEGDPARPAGWTVTPDTIGVVVPGPARNGATSATLRPQPDGRVDLVHEQPVEYPEIGPGTALYAEIHFKAPEQGVAVLSLGFERRNGQRYNVELENNGGPDWNRVYRITTLPDDVAPGVMGVTVTLRAEASGPVSVSGLRIRPVYVPESP